MFKIHKNAVASPLCAKFDQAPGTFVLLAPTYSFRLCFLANRLLPSNLVPLF